MKCHADMVVPKRKCPLAVARMERSEIRELLLFRRIPLRFIRLLSKKLKTVVLPRGRLL